MKQEIQGSFTHYKVNQKQLDKVISRTNKCSRMIDPSDVVDGHEFLSTVLCKGCNMIPTKPIIRECKSCQSIICDKCYLHAHMEVNDRNFDREQEFRQGLLTEEELDMGILINPACPVCSRTLYR